MGRYRVFEENFGVNPKCFLYAILVIQLGQPCGDSKHDKWKIANGT